MTRRIPLNREWPRFLLCQFHSLLEASFIVPSAVTILMVGTRPIWIKKQQEESTHREAA